MIIFRNTLYLGEHLIPESFDVLENSLGHIYKKTVVEGIFCYIG
jgi:hypothetical protein